MDLRERVAAAIDEGEVLTVKSPSHFVSVFLFLVTRLLQRCWDVGPRPQAPRRGAPVVLGFPEQVPMVIC